MVLHHFKSIRTAHIDNIFNGYQKRDESAAFKVLVDMSVVLLVLLSCYVLWEYVKFYKRRCRFWKPIKCIDVDGDFVYNVEECPICLNGFTIPTRLACGHVYCLNCLVTYFSYNHLEFKCICPLCRSIVNSTRVLNNYDGDVNESEKKILKKLLNEMILQQKKDLMLAKPWKAVPGRILTITFLCTVVIAAYFLFKGDNCTNT